MKVFWEANSVYVVPKDELGQKLIFTESGPAIQTVALECNLIGIFTIRFGCRKRFFLLSLLFLRFYTVDSSGVKMFINEEPEVLL